MRHNARWLVVLFGIGSGATVLSCGGETSAPWTALMDDGDIAVVAPGAAGVPSAASLPQRSCSDCSGDPLAFWMFDDCNAASTELQDSATTSVAPSGAPISHLAFRAVSVACVASNDGEGVQLSGPDDIVYAPDQPDFVFNQGLTIAAWINPVAVTGTQTIARKRLDGTSSFTLAIDSKQLTFVVRLTNGRLVGVTAPVKAGRFTHVAGTYDGQQVLLYLNGTLAAKTKAVGTIAPGVGPIFVGNDANGRQFKGIVDDVWLNTLAATADEVMGLTCIRKAPVVSLSPGQTPPEVAGTTVPFTLSVTNPSGASCPADTFEFYASSLPFPLSVDTFSGFPTVGPGQTVKTTINVTAFDEGVYGPFSFQYTAIDTANFSLSATATATYVATPPPPPTRTGCATAPTQPVAPGGYYVNGNTICTGDGRPHLLHGVDRPSLEWNSSGVNLSAADFQLMGSWNANVVRIALNQDFWLAGSPIADPFYADTVDTAVKWAEQAGMDVILDLHWSDAGVLGGCNPANGCQQLMPDANSLTFWSQVAARYQKDGRVMFELYNEPHDVSPDVWKSGGDTGAGWQAVGMQQLYDAVRATGAQNLVLIGGLNWAYDLSMVPTERIAGYNIVYATHPYGDANNPSSRPPSDWQRAFGFLTVTDPVVATEFGVLNDNACTTDYDAQVIQYADAHFMSWTSWAWYPGGCLFPALINDWSGTPSATGSIVKPALLGYNDPPASPPLAGGGGPDVSYTFDEEPQGWSFNTFDDPNSTNLGVRVPDGGSPPTLGISTTDGNPTPGSLLLTVDFTALDQYVDPNVNFGQPGLNLSGKTLHAMIRLVSGSISAGGLQMHASSGASFIYGSETFVDGASLSPGTWVPLTLDLGAITASGFDPTQIVQIGIQFFSGFSSNGGTFTSTGPAVFEIDTVTD